LTASFLLFYSITMLEAPPPVGQPVESSDITSESVLAKIAEFFEDPWQGNCIPFLKGRHLIQPYNDFIKDKEEEFYNRLAEAGNDTVKLQSLLFDLNEFTENIEGRWGAIAKKVHQDEEELRDSVFDDFLEHLPGPGDGSEIGSDKPVHCG